MNKSQEIAPGKRLLVLVGQLLGVPGVQLDLLDRDALGGVDHEYPVQQVAHVARQRGHVGRDELRLAPALVHLLQPVWQRGQINESLSWTRRSGHARGAPEIELVVGGAGRVLLGVVKGEGAQHRHHQHHPARPHVRLPAQIYDLNDEQTK